MDREEKIIHLTAVIQGQIDPSTFIGNPLIMNGIKVGEIVSAHSYHSKIEEGVQVVCSISPDHLAMLKSLIINDTSTFSQPIGYEIAKELEEDMFPESAATRREHTNIRVRNVKGKTDPSRIIIRPFNIRPRSNC